MDLTGKCFKVLEPLSGVSARTGEPWVKNSFLIETAGEYPKKCVFTVFGEDRWKQMGIVVGGEYQVSFDIDAREYNGKWYNDVSAWKAVRLDGQQQTAQQPSNSAPAASRGVSQSPTAEPQYGGGDDSNLPF